MNFHRFSDNAVVKSAFNVAITAAAVNGATIDTQGYRRAAALFNTSPTGAGTTSACKLQDSPDGTTWTDVTGGAFTQGTTAAGNTVQFLNIDLAYRQRYIRLVHTGAGAAAAGQAAGEVLLMQPYNAAPTNDVAPASV